MSENNGNNNMNKRNFEDVSSYSEEYAQQVISEIKKGSRSQNKFQNFWTANRNRNIKRAVCLFAVFVVIFASVAAVFISQKLNMITIDPGDFSYNGETTTENFEDEQFDAMHDIHDASSLDDLLYQWYNQGNNSIMSQDYILNVLLLGIDSKDGKMVSGRSDAIILVSLNKKTKKVTLVSFLRDCRTYMEAGGSRTTKLNEAYFYGGPYSVMKCIENDYKIRIDNYIAVDFYTFPKLIDALGGLHVEVQEYEARYINKTTKYTIDYGKDVTLTGNEALVFSRIRHSDADADISRTRRHRQVISALIKSASTASAGQLNNAMNIALPYVRTDMPKTKILSLVTQALAQDWMNYDMEQVRMPSDNSFKDAMLHRTFFWVVDYPMAARELQTALYGTTNIELDAGRVSALDFISVNDSYAAQSSTSSGTPATNAPTNAPETTTSRGSVFDGWFQNIIGSTTAASGGDAQTQTSPPVTEAPPAETPTQAAPTEAPQQQPDSGQELIQ